MNKNEQAYAERSYILFQLKLATHSVEFEVETINRFGFKQITCFWLHVFVASWFGHRQVC